MAFLLDIQMSAYKLSADHNHTTECFKRMSSRVCVPTCDTKPNISTRQSLVWLVVLFAALGGAVACIAKEPSSTAFISSDKLQLIGNDVCGEKTTAIWINEVTLECFKEL